MNKEKIEVLPVVEVIITIDPITKTPRAAAIIQGRNEPVITYPAWQRDPETGLVTIDYSQEDRAK